jgi:hypothetical protein
VPALPVMACRAPVAPIRRAATAATDLRVHPHTCGCPKLGTRHATVPILLEEPAESVVPLNDVDLGSRPLGWLS